MAKSQYEYVKTFEMADALLPQCWIVCRVDGVAFTKSVEQQTAQQSQQLLCGEEVRNHALPGAEPGSLSHAFLLSANTARRRFTAAHHLEKPNDRRAMNVMNTAAKAVMAAYPDICIGIGMSDEYSFVLHPMSTLYSRRAR